MESRSGRRRLGAQPPRGAGRDCRGGDGGGVDHISGLSDDVLIQILARLRCTRAAARTSVLSRRWRESGLWRHLPEHSLRGIAYSALKAALIQVALPKLSLLDIDIPDTLNHPQAVASLLRFAARLDPVELSISIFQVNTMAIEVPSFARATSIKLNVNNLHLTPPALGGEFPALERLSITNTRRFDTGALISRCPRLRVLELIGCRDLDCITVDSSTIEELLVITERLRHVHIVAPVLKKFTMSGRVPLGFKMSFIAPAVEIFSWNCSFTRSYDTPEVQLHGSRMWYLNDLKLGTEERGFVLSLDLGRPYSMTHHVRDLQEMFQFPNISVLELCLTTLGHVYGAVVLNLLRICNDIRRLKLVLRPDKWRAEACRPNCPCDQQQNWRSQSIFLMGLEEVEIENFGGRDHEVDFLKLLFRCAPLTKVIVKLASNVVASSRGCKQVCNIFKANPDAECHVYHECGNEVVYT